MRALALVLALALSACATTTGPKAQAEAIGRVASASATSASGASLVVVGLIGATTTDASDSQLWSGVFYVGLGLMVVGGLTSWWAIGALEEALAPPPAPAPPPPTPTPTTPDENGPIER